MLSESNEHTLSDDIARLKDAMWGTHGNNGVTGRIGKIEVRMSTLEGSIEEIKQHAVEEKAARKQLMLGILFAVLGAMGNIALSLLKLGMPG